MVQKFFVISLMVVFSFSCNSGGNDQNSDTDSVSTVQVSQDNSSLPDVSGEYKLPQGGCDLVLTIKKESNAFRYYFKGKGGIIDMEGALLLSKDADIYYVTFDGPIGNNAPKTVSGQYNDNTVTIQNYGNAENNFQVFTDCEEKYLEFKKK